MTITKAELDFRNAMRKLWEDHITWTRMFVVGYSAGLPDTELAIKRLLKNQEDIGKAIKIFYGEGMGNILADLLKKHILVAANVLLAVKYKDKPRLEDVNKTWFLNADEIAALLSGANPFLDEDKLKAMLYDHLRFTSEEAVARLDRKYEADIVAYDNVHEQALQMADALSEGIIKQFPNHFG